MGLFLLIPTFYSCLLSLNLSTLSYTYFFYEESKSFMLILLCTFYPDSLSYGNEVALFTRML